MTPYNPVRQPPPPADICPAAPFREGSCKLSKRASWSSPWPMTGPDGDLALAQLHGERLTVPELADLEVASVLRQQMKAGTLDARRLRLALDDLAALSARRAPRRSLLPRCWELRDNLTIYAAAYVALAKPLGATCSPATRNSPEPPAPDAPSRSSSLHPEHFVRAGGLSGGVAS